MTGWADEQDVDYYGNLGNSGNFESNCSSLLNLLNVIGGQIWQRLEEYQVSLTQALLPPLLWGF